MRIATDDPVLGKTHRDRGGSGKLKGSHAIPYDGQIRSRQVVRANGYVLCAEPILGKLETIFALRREVFWSAAKFS